MRKSRLVKESVYESNISDTCLLSQYVRTNAPAEDLDVRVYTRWKMVPVKSHSHNNFSRPLVTKRVF